MRKLPVHGGRAALPSPLASNAPLGQWLSGFGRTQKNAAVLAHTNKLAWIVWAVFRHV
ncbi:MAG: hypothetical protein P4L90_04980 [Rhodopila sp.]|nr:hypothetical protein [Rhodopila sp.]